MIKALSILVIATVAITSFTLSYPAQSESFFERIFGSSDSEKPVGPPPEKTLQAPFPTDASPKQPAGNTALMGMYDNTGEGKSSLSDLAHPHRNEKQIIEWTTEIVSQAMTINLKTYQSDFKKIESNFTPYGLKEYQDYLQKTNMMNVLSSNSYRLQSVSDEEGSVIKADEIAGTYHWLVQIPLMTSFYSNTMQPYDKNTNVESQHLLVQVQVGRVPPKSKDDVGLTIERWGVSSYSK